MSSEVIETPYLASDERDRRRAYPRAIGSFGRGAAAAIAPALAAGVALLVHLFVPNQQLTPPDWTDALAAWKHPYPLLLEVALGVSLLITILQGVLPRIQPRVRHHGPLVAGFLTLLLLWDLITLKLNWMSLPYFMGPDSVLAAMIEDRAMLMQCTYHSLLLLLSGYFTGIIVGLVTGVLIGWFVLVRYWSMPVLKLIGPIPATALIPLAMTISSHSFISGAALIAFAVWFPVTMLTLSGIANVRLSYLDVARTLGAGRLYLIFRVAIPAAMPLIFIGVFMGLIVSFLALIVAEGTGVQAGLGWYLKWQQGYVEYAKVYAALIILAVFCSGIMTLLFKLRDRVLAWQKGVIKW